jgi:hypothetical protein
MDRSLQKAATSNAKDDKRLEAAESHGNPSRLDARIARAISDASTVAESPIPELLIEASSDLFSGRRSVRLNRGMGTPRRAAEDDEGESTARWTGEDRVAGGSPADFNPTRLHSDMEYSTPGTQKQLLEVEDTVLTSSFITAPVNPINAYHGFSLGAGPPVNRMQQRLPELSGLVPSLPRLVHPQSPESAQQAATSDPRKVCKSSVHREPLTLDRLFRFERWTDNL